MASSSSEGGASPKKKASSGRLASLFKRGSLEDPIYTRDDVINLSAEGHTPDAGGDVATAGNATVDGIPVTELRGRHVSSTQAVWLEAKLTSPCFGLLFSGNANRLGGTLHATARCVNKSEVRPFAMLPPLRSGLRDGSAGPDEGRWSVPLAVRLLLTEWGLEPPRVVVAIIGDNGRLSVGAEERRGLSEGLQQVAQSNTAWVLLPGERAETDRFVNHAMAGLRMPIIETAVVKMDSPQLARLQKAGGRCVRQPSPTGPHCTSDRAEPAIVSSTATHHVLLQLDGKGGPRTMPTRLATIQFQLELADFIKDTASSAGVFGVKGSVTSIGVFIAGSPSTVQECLVAARHRLPLLIVGGVGGASEIIAHQIRTRQAATKAKSDRPAAAAVLAAAEIKLTALLEDTFMELSLDAMIAIRLAIDEIVNLSEQTDTISIANQADLAPALLAKLLELPEFDVASSPARVQTPTPVPAAGREPPRTSNTDCTASGPEEHITQEGDTSPTVAASAAHPQPLPPRHSRGAGRLGRLKRLEMAILFDDIEAQQRELGNFRILPDWGAPNEISEQNDPALQPQIQMIKHCLLNTESSIVISSILNQLSEDSLRDILRSKIMWGNFYLHKKRRAWFDALPTSCQM